MKRALDIDWSNRDDDLLSASPLGLENVVTVPSPGVYRHFKGGEYQVLEVARHSETEELLVVYRPLNGDDEIWVRPLEMFVGHVRIDDSEVPRFQQVATREGILGGLLPESALVVIRRLLGRSRKAPAASANHGRARTTLGGAR